ncbi:endocytosis ankyrin repeat protein [Fusarium sp. NRRL 52700]|nr:endocytosis ankyrin repeat protein [Fusarium sp. NRRL 52700]
MSGLEILGAIASSIALAQAVQGTLKAIDFLRQNSDMKGECNKLRKEILMIDCFIMQAREQTDPMMPAQRLIGSTEHPLVSLTIQELEEILEELNEIVEKYSRSRKVHDPKRFTDKVKWLSDAGKIEELRERAQATKSNLHMAITFRVSSMVDRGNLTSSERRASLMCHPSNPSVHVYVAPNAIVDVTKNDGTTLVHGQLPSSLHGSFDMIQQTMITEADAGASPALSSNFGFQAGYGQESYHFRHPEDPISASPYVYQGEGLVYFPDDTAGSDWPLLSMALYNQSSDCVEILLKLWGNILPSQGLSRNTGYELKQYYTDGSKPEIDMAIDKTLSFVQDWDEVSTTKVHIAAGGGGEVLDALREQPWLIDELDEYGEAPIHVAVGNNNFEGLEQLMAAKADVNRQNPSGYTPLMIAAAYGKDTMLQKLLEHSECQRRISQGNIQGLTALHFAAKSGSLACARLLLQAGAPASKTDEYGRTPMHYLAWVNQEHQQEIYEAITLLQDYGADIESKDLNGITPLLWACQKGHVVVMEALVMAGASLGAIDSNRNGILHAAAFSNNLDVVHCLAEQDLEGIDSQLQALDLSSTPLGNLRWVFDDYFPNFTTLPSQEQQQTFIKFYFKLLIRDLECHMSTLRNIQEAIQDSDSEAATELLDILINRNEESFRQELVDWYRGLKFYVSDGQWDQLKEAICEEYDETYEKTKRAAIARGKTMTDPELEEFF